MPKPKNLGPGYGYCKKGDHVYAGEICTQHMLDRPVTLDRYRAKVLYDLAISLGIERKTVLIPEQAEIILELIDGIEAGEFIVTLAPTATLGPNGFEAE